MSVPAHPHAAGRNEMGEKMESFRYRTNGEITLANGKSSSSYHEVNHHQLMKEGRGKKHSSSIGETKSEFCFGQVHGCR